MTGAERLEYLMRLFQVIDPGIAITPEYRVKGTTLLTLASTGSGGYERVVAWAEKKADEIHLADKLQEAPMEKDKDVEALEVFFAECVAIFKEKGLKYGKSWLVLSPESTANLIEMKANRAVKMGARNPKSLDETTDMAVYAGLLNIKLKQL